MMKLKEIMTMATTVDAGNGQKLHESVFRGYQALMKVRELLSKNCPPDVVVEIIDEIMESPSVEHRMQTQAQSLSGIEFVRRILEGERAYDERP